MSLHSIPNASKKNANPVNRTSLRMEILRRQRGGIAISTAVMLTMLLGFSALAIDIGNVLVARNELQNGADAAALAAAPCLYPRTECGNAKATAPDWATAEQKARDAVAMNGVQGVLVKVGVAGSGYWDITGSKGLQSPPISVTSNDLPAVRVTITKSAGNSNGAVKTFLAGILGVSAMEPAATATAVVSSPGTVGSKSLFPIALSSCLFSNYWDTSTNSPKTAPDNNPLPGQTVSQTKGQPYVFQVGSSFQVGLCEAGQWTTFTKTQNNVPFVQGLINGQNTDSLSIGQTPGTYVQPGEENSLFKYVSNCAASSKTPTCEWGIVPVVNSLSTKTYHVVQAFACVHILDANNGVKPYVLMQMSSDTSKCLAKGAGGIGTNYGVLMPPRLVQ